MIVTGFSRASILMALGLLLCLAVPSQAGKTLHFGYIGAELSYSSLAVLKAAYAKLGIAVEGRVLPAARALSDSAAGLTDGEVHRIREIAYQHPQLIRIDVPVNHVEGLAVSYGQRIDTSSVEGIRNYSIGVKIGTRYALRLVQGMPKVEQLASEKKLIELLTRGRLDIVIGDRPWANNVARKLGDPLFTINEPPLVSIPLYHYLHEKNAELVPEISRVLQEMVESGERDEIIREAQEYVLSHPVPQH